MIGNSFHESLSLNEPNNEIHKKFDQKTEKTSKETMEVPISPSLHNANKLLKYDERTGEWS